MKTILQTRLFNYLLTCDDVGFNVNFTLKLGRKLLRKQRSVENNTTHVRSTYQPKI